MPLRNSIFPDVSSRHYTSTVKSGCVRTKDARDLSESDDGTSAFVTRPVPTAQHLGTTGSVKQSHLSNESFSVKRRNNEYTQPEATTGWMRLCVVRVQDSYQRWSASENLGVQNLRYCVGKEMRDERS